VQVIEGTAIVSVDVVPPEGPLEDEAEELIDAPPEGYGTGLPGEGRKTGRIPESAIAIAIKNATQKNTCEPRVLSLAIFTLQVIHENLVPLHFASKCG